MIARAAALFADGHGPVSAARHLVQAGGIFLHRASRSIWIHGEEPAHFCAAQRLIEKLKDATPENRFFFTASRPATFDWLRACFPNDGIVPAPLGDAGSVRRFFDAIGPRLVILLCSASGVPPRALRQASGREIPVVAIDVAALEKSAAWTPSLVITREAVGRLFFESGPSAPASDPAYLRRELGIAAGSPVVIFENLPRADETSALAAISSIQRACPEAVCLIEPRERSRLRALARALPGATRRSQRAWGSRVILLDQPGELPSLHRLAACVVAGAILPACATSAPLILRKNADALSTLLLERRAAMPLRGDLAGTILHLIHDPAEGARILANARALAAEQTGATARTFAALEPYLPRQPGAQRGRMPWRFQKRLPTRLLEFAAARLHLRERGRIDGWPALSAHLRSPRAILCLGNGPSCEDPRLPGCGFDCLFRANWSWRARGFLAEPDAVFVGDLRSIHFTDAPLFVFRDIEQEIAALPERLRRLHRGAIRFFTMERAPSLLSAAPFTALPTSGALMVIAAAALQPERLIIGGFDLFLHPDGRHAGDFYSSNRYAQAHEREVEIEIIRRALADFRGEIVIMSDILRDSLALGK